MSEFNEALKIINNNLNSSINEIKDYFKQTNSNEYNFLIKEEEKNYKELEKFLSAFNQFLVIKSYNLDIETKEIEKTIKSKLKNKLYFSIFNILIENISIQDINPGITDENLDQANFAVLDLLKK